VTSVEASVRPNFIHPTAVIGAGVMLGEGNQIGPYAVIFGPCTIGDDNWIGPHVAIGTPAQSRSHHHSRATTGGTGEGVRIGNRNVIREFATVHQGTVRTTELGSGCYLMAYTHVSHDSILMDEVTLSNGTQLGGHAWIGMGANLGLGTVAHQFATIGAYAMIGMQSMVKGSIEPFTVATGIPARVQRLNIIGLERAGFGDSIIALEGRHDSRFDGALPAELRRHFEMFEDHRRTSGRP
jgi:UDP-N-acetylglucosamine acyltransferase